MIWELKTPGNSTVFNATGVDMKRNEVLFIVAVILVAGAYLFLSVQQIVELSSAAKVQSRAAGAAGVPRDIDVEQFKRLLEMKKISGHEADFYKPYTGPVAPAEPDAEKQEEGPPSYDY